MNIYQYNSQGIYTGRTQEIADNAGCPRSWTRAALPTIPSGKFAKFTGRVWVIIDELPAEPEPTTEEIALAMEVAIDAYIDSVAQAKGYDSRITAALRAGYENPWQAEGIVFGQWMDSVYAYCQQVQVDALAGNRTIPTAEELIAELPEIIWPE